MQCRYNDCILATGSVDKSIKIWDVRNPGREMLHLQGHGYAVRKVIFSPHAENILASCSYDMTVKLWDVANPQAPLTRNWDHHSEFAVGLDFSVLREGLIAILLARNARMPAKSLRKRGTHINRVFSRG
eukprot:gene22846-30020_t